MRVLIDLPANQIDDLARLCQTEKISRAELVRRAVSRYLAENKPASSNAFGLWRKQGLDRPDGLVWQEQVRSEW
jgi:hypothetical protein